MAKTLNRWSQFAHLTRLVWALGPGEILLVGCLHILSGLFPICMVVALRHMVDHTVKLTQGNGNLHATLLWLGGLMGISYLTWASSPLREWLSYSILARFKGRIQEQLLQKASRVDLHTFEAPPFFDQLHRAHRGVDERLLNTLQVFFPIPAHLVTCLGLLVYLATLAWWLPLVLLVGLVPGHLLERRFDRKRYVLAKKHTPPQRRMDYLGDLMIQRAAAAEIRLFNLETHLFSRWQTLFFQLRNERLRLAFGRIQAIVAGVISDQVAFSLVLMGIVGLVARGSLSVGTYAASMDAVVHFRDGALLFFNGLRNMEDDLQYLGDVLAYLAIEEEVPGDRLALEAGIINTVPEIRFENVSFVYPGSETPVLNGINLTIEPGERIALVGENGAGKTTLAKLLLKLYRPTSGRILVDGTDLAALDLLAWRKRVGAVFQDYVRYQITLRENIAFGNLERLGDEAAIEAAAQKSGANSVVASLALGYDTVLGRVYDESGQDLSVGQWQRLAIARAYLGEAGILVLDEPTAALDARAEVAVYRQFEQMSKGKTVVLVSHRLGSARLADRIVFLAGGRVEETGSHDVLIKQGGHYATMYGIQAKWYLANDYKDTDRE